ncbi:hypothetical protein FRC0360_00110 [Corynebacterium diphtheriae]|nr:hypothetical protein CIPA99_00116 [Corynebacterium diphtheriae]CAB0842529.1 hypothetical protein FRC0360_00110 [Corynebacterium diphtheriae]CAB0992349.1 hypothetical protein FRC0522_00076 [Corynebacterium diphtheriae]
MGEITQKIPHATLTRKLESGEIIRVTHGLYWQGDVSVDELAAALCRRGFVLTGATELELLARQPLTLPLHVVANRRVKSTEYVVIHRSSVRKYARVADMLIELPVYAMRWLGRRQAIRLAEIAYAGREGRARLERHAQGAVPVRVREIVQASVIGADSPPERDLVRALRSAGVECESNVRVGDYRWDIRICGSAVLIEVDGYAYHNAENRETFRLDRWKANDATLRGYLVLRYSAVCVRESVDVIVDQVVQAVQCAPKQLRDVDEARCWHRGAWKWIPGLAWL